MPFEYEKISWNGVVGSVSFLFESLPEPTSIPSSTDLYLYMLFDVNGINSEHFYSYQIFNVGFTEVPDIEVNNVNYTFDWQPMKILDSGYVYLNQNGEIAINNVYGYAETFQNDLAVVGELISEGQDNRFKVLISKGMIDRNGEVIIPIVYQELVNHYNCYYLVKTNEKWGVINRENKFIVPQEFDQ
ncbi:MAG: WG repeat-containing protein, partial [Candidatus Hydrogenedentes bacterium]|nr:WG repeat-containing protein [Candidatus Hydrogenedentota bacterium]